MLTLLVILWELVKVIAPTLSDSRASGHTNDVGSLDTVSTDTRQDPVEEEDHGTRQLERSAHLQDHNQAVNETDQPAWNSDESNLYLDQVDPAVMAQIEFLFRTFIDPRNVLSYFHLYNRDVLTTRDMQKIRKDTENNGQIEGATTLIEYLPKYAGWMRCLWQVLSHPDVKLKHVAKLLAGVVGIDDTSMAEMCGDENMGQSQTSDIREEEEEHHRTVPKSVVDSSSVEGQEQTDSAGVASEGYSESERPLSSQSPPPVMTTESAQPSPAMNLTDKLSAYETEIRHLRETVAAKEETNKMWEASWRQILRNVQEQHKRMAEVQGEVTRTQVLNLQDRIKSLEARIVDREGEIKEQAEQHKKTLEEIKKEHGEEQQQLMAKISKLQETVEKKDKDLEAALEDVSRWKEQVEQHKKILEEIKEEHGEEEQQLIAEISRLQETVEKKDKDLEAALEDVKKWKDRQQTESRQPVGFKAELPTGQTISLTPGTILRCLTEVTMDTGHHYVPSTGVFTVPVSGRYQVILRHSQERGDSGGGIRLWVLHERRKVGVGQGEESRVCETMTCGSRWVVGGMTSKVQDSSEDVVQLGVGDRLWVKVEGVLSDEKLVSPTCVSCVLFND